MGYDDHNKDEDVYYTDTTDSPDDEPWTDDEIREFMKDKAVPVSTGEGGSKDSEDVNEIYIGMSSIVALFLFIMTIYGLYIQNFRFAMFSMTLVVVLVLGSKFIM